MVATSAAERATIGAVIRLSEPGAPLERTETAVLRGIAILVIVLHNFLHALPASPGENEFDFDAARGAAFVEGLQAEPAGAVRLLASYFGHYAVQIFIVLSAYGLTRRFRSTRPRTAEFLRSRVEKIVPTFLLAIATYLVWTGMFRGWLGPFDVLSQHWYSLLLKITLLSNFVPDQALRPVGPWWFVPFIFQWYAVFPLLRTAHARWGTPALWAIAVVGLAAVAANPLAINLLFTVVGHLPALCLGVWLASRDELRVPFWMVLLAVPLFVLGNLYRPFWYTASISAAVLMLGAWQLGEAWAGRRGAGQRALAFLGALSLPLLLVHGFLRQPFLGWAAASGAEGYALLMALVFLVISVIAAVVLSAVERALRRAVHDWRSRRMRVAVAS